MKLREQIASLNHTLERFEASLTPSRLMNKLDSLRAEQTALIATYTMHENHKAGYTAEDLRKAIARPVSR